MKTRILFIGILIIAIILWVNITVALLNYFQLSIPSELLSIIIILPAAIVGIVILSETYSIIKHYFTKLMSKTTNKKFNSNTELIGYLIGKYWYVILILVIFIFIFNKFF